MGDTRAVVVRSPTATLRSLHGRERTTCEKAVSMMVCQWRGAPSGLQNLNEGLAKKRDHTISRCLLI